MRRCVPHLTELVPLFSVFSGGVEFRDDHGDDAPAVRNIFVYAQVRWHLRVLLSESTVRVAFVQHRVSAGPGRRRAAGKAGAPAVPLITRTERFLPSTTEIVVCPCSAATQPPVLSRSAVMLLSAHRTWRCWR